LSFYINQINVNKAISTISFISLIVSENLYSEQIAQINKVNNKKITNNKNKKDIKLSKCPIQKDLFLIQLSIKIA